MSTNNTVRNEVKRFAQQIETLAREVQVKLDQGGDPLTVANELVRSNSTFTFVLGEMYGLESLSNKKHKATTVSNPSNTPTVNYRHSLRDSSGRFAKKV